MGQDEQLGEAVVEDYEEYHMKLYKMRQLTGRGDPEEGESTAGNKRERSMTEDASNLQSGRDTDKGSAVGSPVKGLNPSK